MHRCSSGGFRLEAGGAEQRTGHRWHAHRDCEPRGAPRTAAGRHEQREAIDAADLDRRGRGGRARREGHRGINSRANSHQRREDAEHEAPRPRAWYRSASRRRRAPEGLPRGPTDPALWPGGRVVEVGHASSMPAARSASRCSRSACSSTQGGRKLIRAGTLAGRKAARVRGRRAAGRFARRRPRPAAGRARNPPGTRSRRRPPCRRRRPSAARSPRASPHQTWSPSDRSRLPNQRVTTPPCGETSRPRRPCAHLVRNGADAPSAPTTSWARFAAQAGHEASVAVVNPDSHARHRGLPSRSLEC